MNTKGLYDNFMVYENGIDRFVDNPVAIQKMQLSSEKVKFIKNYLTLIMDTNIVSDTTKLYIRCHSTKAIKPSFEEIIKERNRKGIKPELNINTCLSKVTYDTKKLLRYFPNDMIEKLRNVNTHNITSYQNFLYKAIEKYRPESELSGKLVIELPMSGINDKLSDSEFSDFLKIIEPYSVKFVEQLIKDMPEKYIQYYNYLRYVENKSNLDIDRMNKLKKVLAGEKIGAAESLEQNEIIEDKDIEFNMNDFEIDEVDKPMKEIPEKFETERTKDKVEIRTDGYVRVTDKSGLPRLVKADKYFSELEKYQ